MVERWLWDMSRTVRLRRSVKMSSLIQLLSRLLRLRLRNRRSVRLRNTEMWMVLMVLLDRWISWTH